MPSFSIKSRYSVVYGKIKKGKKTSLEKIYIYKILHFIHIECSGMQRKIIDFQWDKKK